MSRRSRPARKNGAARSRPTGAAGPPAHADSGPSDAKPSLRGIGIVSGIGIFVGIIGAGLGVFNTCWNIQQDRAEARSRRAQTHVRVQDLVNQGQDWLGGRGTTPRIGSTQVVPLNDENDRRRFVVAERLANEALALQPNSIPAMTLLENAYDAVGAHERAEEVIERALKIAPSNTDLWLDLAITRESRKDYEGSIEASQKVAQLDPKNGFTYNTWAVDLFLQGKYARAVAKASIAVKLCPNFPEAHNTLGNALVALHRLSDGIREIRIAANQGSEGALKNLKQLDPTWKAHITKIPWQKWCSK